MSLILSEMLAYEYAPFRTVEARFVDARSGRARSQACYDFLTSGFGLVSFAR